MPRTIVIGDIHGALKALKQVIDEIRPQQEDLLIFLGDYVDGWSESAQVIEYVMELNKSIPCIFIKGNHDAWCEGWLDGASPSPIWLANGGQATIESYANISSAKKREHLAFFRRMYNYYVDAQNRLFIHAGFSSMHGPAYEHYQSNYSWDRTLWEMALAMDKGIEKDALTYPKRLLLFHEIYIGHTPTLRYNKDVPMQACNVWNIDTGAAFTGKISAMDIDTREVWQSDPAPMLYPDEKGRNK
jgi:serine/threonine protein phosphatase 1